MRESWANIQNKSLERHNLAPVTHLSYKELGLDIKPTKHLGKHATALERKGVKTFLGERNDAIRRANKAVIKSATDSIFDREDRAPEFDYFETKRTNSFIEAANSFIAERATYTAPSPSTARAREQLATARARAERRANRELKRATKALEHNLPRFASRLAWRKEHSQKYDERQMQELDAFYKTLNVRDFTLKNNKPYISPGNWFKPVLERLTVDDILENPQIFQIVADPEQERQKFTAKTPKFNDSQSFTGEVVQTPIRESKTSQSEDLTPSRPTNTFRPR